MIINCEYVETKKELAENIKAMRKDMGFTQQQMADALGIERSTYTYYETAKTLPDIFTLIRISKIFNIDVFFLIVKKGRDFLRKRAHIR